MSSQTQPAHCLYCEQNSDVVPLIAVQFRGNELWICPQHLPILIHKPSQLGDKLPGSTNLKPADHHD